MSARDGILFKNYGNKAQRALQGLSVLLGHRPTPAQSPGLCRGEVSAQVMRSQTFYKPIKLIRGDDFLFSLAEKITPWVAVSLPWIFLSFSLTERSYLSVPFIFTLSKNPCFFLF